MNQSMIVSDPAIMMGKPVIAGTRIIVELILEKLASGESIEQLIEAHPRLTRETVLAALDLPLKRRGLVDGVHPRRKPPTMNTYARSSYAIRWE